MTQDSKSNTTVPLQSVANSAGSLAERLKAKSQQEVIAIREQTQNELALHQERLSALSKAALDTTGSAISSHVSTVKTKLLGSENEIKTALNEAAAEINTQGQSIAQTLGSTDKRVKAALGKTTSALSQQQKELREALQKQTQQMLWLMKLPLLVLVAVCLGICGGAWGWTQYQLAEAAKASQMLLQTQAEQQEAAATLSKLREQTWGLSLQEDSTGKYVVMPPGVEPSTGWLSGSRKAVRLGKN